MLFVTKAYLSFRLLQLLPQLGILSLEELYRLVVDLNGTFQLINLRDGMETIMTKAENKSSYVAISARMTMHRRIESIKKFKNRNSKKTLRQLLHRRRHLFLFFSRASHAHWTN